MTSWSDCQGIHRRSFLQIGTAGLMGMTLPDLLRGEAQAAAPTRSRRKATNVIMVYLPGGPATIDMWDMKPEAPENIRGEFPSIETKVAGLRVCEHLPRVAKVMDKCTLVRSVSHTIGDHELGMVYLTTGNRPTTVLKYPLLGSLTSNLLPAARGVPAFVTFMNRNRGADAGYLGAAYNPYTVDAVSEKGKMRVKGLTLPTGFTLDLLDDRNKLLAQFDSSFKALDEVDDLVSGLDQFQKQALDILRSDKTRNAFDTSKEPEAIRDRYGRAERHTQDSFGQSALIARRLIEAGARFVTIGAGRWDTHGQNFKALKEKLLPELDQTLSALLHDLDEKGLLETTLVYCTGEFGRTPRVNKDAGRDHWARAMTVLLAGGGVRRGYVHGSTDNLGSAPNADPCKPDDISATLFQCLGLNPHQELMTSTGRPITLFRDGQIVEKLLG